ncbi:hypothetical protein Pa4123_89630 [Phytohabitans aurantiacus]|uniref:Uncharacterized protein n=1 Tax=Phytohabitans aurantiacus TaxID=3016789 RepID=A0ABQ5RA89_9ACTN|nr:hypothetical protein Pa4123_89630 [Phytohabitans aurantiacus]
MLTAALASADDEPSSAPGALHAAASIASAAIAAPRRDKRVILCSGIYGSLLVPAPGGRPHGRRRADSCTAQRERVKFAKLI